VPGNLAAVRELMQHPAFSINNPNSCYSLFLGFARSPVNFHAGEEGDWAPWSRGGGVALRAIHALHDLAFLPSRGAKSPAFGWAPAWSGRLGRPVG
jgi:hypothetical protein